MGFDPRQQQRVTTNVDSLLAENDALRREVQRLNRELDRLRQRDQQDSNQGQSSTGTPRRITDGQVLRWGQAMARQPGWIGLQSESSILTADLAWVETWSLPASSGALTLSSIVYHT